MIEESLRLHSVPEQLVQAVMSMYAGPKFCVEHVRMQTGYLAGGHLSPYRPLITRSAIWFDVEADLKQEAERIWLRHAFRGVTVCGRHGGSHNLGGARRHSSGSLRSQRGPLRVEVGQKQV